MHVVARADLSKHKVSRVLHKRRMISQTRTVGEVLLGFEHKGEKIQRWFLIPGLLRETFKEDPSKHKVSWAIHIGRLTLYKRTRAGLLLAFRNTGGRIQSCTCVSCLIPGLLNVAAKEFLKAQEVSRALQKDWLTSPTRIGDRVLPVLGYNGDMIQSCTCASCLIPGLLHVEAMKTPENLRSPGS